MKLPTSLALFGSFLVTLSSLNAELVTGFLARTNDPDQTWNGVASSRPTPKVLMTWNGFSVSTIAEYRLTVTAFDNQFIEGGPWTYDSNPINGDINSWFEDDAVRVYNSVYGLYVNDAFVGEFGTTHRAEYTNTAMGTGAAAQAWKGPSSTATFTFAPSTTGALKIEVRAMDPAGVTTSADYKTLKSRRHSVAGFVALGLDGSGITTSALTTLESNITEIENHILVLQNDLSITRSQIESYQTATNGLLGDLETSRFQMQASITALQQQIADQYNALKSLIDANTAAIAQNTGDLASLLEQQTLLQSRVGGIQSDLATLTQTVAEQFADLAAVVADHEERLAALISAQNSTALALAALETAVANNKSVLETKVEELEAKLNQLGVDKDAQIAALQAQISAIQENTVTVTELQTQLTQITAQKDGEIATLQEQIAQLNSSQTSQDAQISQLLNDLNVAKTGAQLTSQALQQQIDALNSQRASQQLEIAGLNQQLEAAKAQKDADIAALQQQINEAKQVNTSQDVDITLLNQRLASLQIEKDNQIADLNIKIGNLTNEKTETDQQLAEVQTQLTAQSVANDQKIATLQGDIDMLLADKVTQDEKIAELQSKVITAQTEKEQQIGALNENISSMTSDYSAQIAALEARISALESQAETNETEHEAEKEQLQKDLAALQSSLNSNKSEVSSLSSQMWAIGAGAALIGITSPGVYDHVKEEGLFESASGTASNGEADSKPFTPGGWYKTPVSAAAAGGWIK